MVVGPEPSGPRPHFAAPAYPHYTAAAGAQRLRERRAAPARVRAKRPGAGTTCERQVRAGEGRVRPGRGRDSRERRDSEAGRGGLTQRRPFLLQALFLDAAQLRLGDEGLEKEWPPLCEAAPSGF